jgi:hypothetical protein
MGLGTTDSIIPGRHAFPSGDLSCFTMHTKR